MGAGQCSILGFRKKGRGYTPGVVQKSAEMTDSRRLAEILFLEECARASKERVYKCAFEGKEPKSAKSIEKKELR